VPLALVPLALVPLVLVVALSEHIQ